MFFVSFISLLLCRPLDTRRHIKAQDLSLKILMNALRTWNFDNNIMKNGKRPIVLAFVGPTGVGKTETAKILAQSLLVKSSSYGKNRRVPNGLVVLRGEVSASVVIFISSLASFSKLLLEAGNRYVIAFVLCIQF